MSTLILGLIGLLCMFIIVVLYVHNSGVTYFDSFSAEPIPKEIKAFINFPLSFVLSPLLRDASQNKNIAKNIFTIKAYDSTMCGYYCIRFIHFMDAGKTLTEFTNLFSPNNFTKIDNIILNYFMNNI